MGELKRSRQLRNSKVKYEFIFDKASSSVLLSLLLKLPIMKRRTEVEQKPSTGCWMKDIRIL